MTTWIVTVQTGPKEFRSVEVKAPTMGAAWTEAQRITGRSIVTAAVEAAQ